MNAAKYLNSFNNASHRLGPLLIRVAQVISSRLTSVPHFSPNILI